MIKLFTNFTATPLTGPAPLNVTFTDTSTGTIANWSWAFGDGQNSKIQNPSHTYDAVGNEWVEGCGIPDISFTL